MEGPAVACRAGAGVPALPDGSSASGSNDISFQGTGGAYVTLGLGGDRAFQAVLGGRYCGNLIHVAASGKWRVVADIVQHEVDENPAGGPVDSNPFGVLAEPGGRLIVDAGANALLRVAANGRVETVAVFAALPNPTGVGPPWIESVPTAVARGPDGALYVGELTGFPFVQELAGIYRVVRGQAPERCCPGGFKPIMDLAFGPDGSLYVVENATGPFPPPPPFAPNSGRLSRVGPGCASVETLLEGLDRPTAAGRAPSRATGRASGPERDPMRGRAPSARRAARPASSPAWAAAGRTSATPRSWRPAAARRASAAACAAARPAAGRPCRPARRGRAAAGRAMLGLPRSMTALAAKPQRPHGGTCSTVVTPLSQPGVFAQALRIDSDCTLTHWGRTSGQTTQDEAQAPPGGDRAADHEHDGRPGGQRRRAEHVVSPAPASSIR